MVTFDHGYPQKLFQVERRPRSGLVCLQMGSPPTVPITFLFLSRRGETGAGETQAAPTWFRAAAFLHKDVIEGDVRGRLSTSARHREGHLFTEGTDGVRGSWPASSDCFQASQTFS